eukprot:3499737-Rhodomonas_salina.1
MADAICLLGRRRVPLRQMGAQESEKCCYTAKMSREILAALFVGWKASDVTAAPQWKVKCSTRVKFREETEERSRRSEEGRSPKPFAAHAKGGEAE